ncbi:MAG: prepilin peptidase [Lachnospiraceae bacterium]|nr:prepilin peptidase [Lachnospiraceae bacterium]
MNLNIILAVFLIPFIISDLREKRIYSEALFLLFLLGLILQYITKFNSFFDILGGMITGIILLCFSMISHEKIGLGDSFIFIITGVWLGTINNLFILIISFFLAGFFGIIFCLIRKKDKSFQIPFVPFIFISLLVLIFLSKGG